MDRGSSLTTYLFASCNQVCVCFRGRKLIILTTKFREAQPLRRFISILTLVILVLSFGVPRPYGFGIKGGT